MSIPVSRRNPSWTDLTQAEKKERLLLAAADLFEHDGLDASIPAIARAAGAGIASVYRQFESKDELLAELVVRRLDEVTASAHAARARTGSRWDALSGLLTRIVEEQSCDEYFGEALDRVAGLPDVRRAKRRTWSALEAVLDEVRGEGRLRADASLLDLRLTFAATRAARHLEPGAERRMLALCLAGLDTCAIKEP